VNKLLMMTDELSETCRVSCQNKFVKLVNLVGFIIKKFATMHGHMNVLYIKFSSATCFDSFLYDSIHGKKCRSGGLPFIMKLCSL